MADTPDLGNEKWLFFAVFFGLFSTRVNHILRGKNCVFCLFQSSGHQTNESGTKSGTGENLPFRGRHIQTKVWPVISLLRVPVSSSGLLKAGGPSQMPTREHSAPSSARSCRHCPQDCAPPSVATLVPMPSPPGRACAANGVAEWQAHRTKNSLLAILTHHSSSLAIRGKPLILIGLCSI
jgi:hypothetical protein